MFRGNFDQKIDEKGRVSVPAKYREVLENAGSDYVFVTNFKVDGFPCLDVYTHAKWLELEARLREPGQRSPRVLKFFQNYYFPGVQECQIDRAGRILICPRLREYGGLEKEVVFAGVMDKLRVFSAANWKQVFATGEESLPDEAEVLMELGM
jgi:MraZ protein